MMHCKNITSNFPANVFLQSINTFVLTGYCFHHNRTHHTHTDLCALSEINQQQLMERRNTRHLNSSTTTFLCNKKNAFAAVSMNLSPNSYFELIASDFLNKEIRREVDKMTKWQREGYVIRVLFPITYNLKWYNCIDKGQVEGCVLLTVTLQ